MSRGPDDFSGITLATDDYEPEQVEGALATIARYARDAADAELLAVVVFGKGRKARFHGDKPPAEVGRARTAWLCRCRDWIEATNGRVLTTSQIPEADQRAYVEATGDVWTPPDAQPADRERHYRYPEPIGDAGAAYRRRVREWAAAQGRATYARGALEAWLLNAYCDATGDVWDPVAQDGASSLVPVGPAREHMQRLNAAGMSQEAMAAAVPMSIGAVSMILRGRTGRSEQTRIRRETEARILAMVYPNPAVDGMAV